MEKDCRKVLRENTYSFSIEIDNYVYSRDLILDVSIYLYDLLVGEKSETETLLYRIKHSILILILLNRYSSMCN